MMAGYRQSSFDPNASGYGRPLRPYNGWQRLGVGMVCAGALVVVVTFLSRIGLISLKIGDFIGVGTSLVLLGSVLVNSRREQVSVERSEKLRRWALVFAMTFMVVAAIAMTVALYFERPVH